MVGAGAGLVVVVFGTVVVVVVVDLGFVVVVVDFCVVVVADEDLSAFFVADEAIPMMRNKATTHAATMTQVLRYQGFADETVAT